MPRTLYGFILRELVKVLGLATAVLVLVISFAAALKPLSDGLLGPVALIKFVLLFMPTTLQFALPFAGALASTLVFSRMVADNEILACCASGMSYRKILAPVAFLGAGLTLVLIILANWVVPSFYQAAERLVQQDFLRLVVTQVQRQEPVTEIEGMVLYADAADDSQPPPQIPNSTVQPHKLIMLRNVVVGQLDDEGVLHNESTAEKADMLLYNVKGQTWVTVRLANVTYFDEAQGRLNHVQAWASPAIRIPSAFKDQPRFLSLSQLLSMSEDPAEFDRVAEARRLLAQAMATQSLLDILQDRLAESAGEQPVQLVGPGDETYDLFVKSWEREQDKLMLHGPVTVRYRSSGLLKRRVEAARGVVKVEADTLSLEPELMVELHQARVEDSATGFRSERSMLTLPRSRLARSTVAPYMEESLAELMAAAQAPPFATMDKVKYALRRLGIQLLSLERHIISQVNQRIAASLNCLLVLLLGAVLSMRMRGVAPLVVYFWTFLMAIIAILVIRSGDNLVTNEDISAWYGIVTIWFGNVLVAAAAAHAYFKLRRN